MYEVLNAQNMESGFLSPQMLGGKRSSTIKSELPCLLRLLVPILAHGQDLCQQHRSRLAVPIQYIPPSRVTHSSSKEDIQKLTDETGEAKAYQDINIMASSTPAVSRKLEGKVALITGGASGIGKRTAEIFAEQGAKVVIADIQDELGNSVAQAIGSSTCLYVHCDVTDENQIKNAVDTTVQTYGKLDIMFNNAGIGGPNNARIIDNDKEDFERVLSINLTGVFLGIKHAAQAMIPARTGSIISTSSISSYVGGAASHAYCCAKHAVVGLTKNAAVELGQFGIRVNCLSPYACATPLATKFVGLNDDMLESTMNLLANLKGVTFKTDDVANAALYFASDDSRYVSGHNLLIDGGFSIVNPSFHMFQYSES
ncbi:secoisolariciresinol dehydrogenase [Trifolium repens]|nr:secoisolariciresinol dehydrogenase [Trifolium repens]